MHQTLPYVAPFAVYILFLALKPVVPAGIQYPLAVTATLVAVLVFSRHLVSFRATNWPGTIGVGVGVFAIWVAPDFLFPDYRSHWLFQNPVMGAVSSSLSDDLRIDGWFLTLRVAGSALLIPVIEELFWRGWLMRWLIRADFKSVPLGTYAAQAFWITAILFAVEHGPYWEVGLVAGVAYNWWMVKTKNLGDLIVAHAITNALLAVWVIARGEWHYWL
jgi:uncharacterized protein